MTRILPLLHHLRHPSKVIPWGLALLALAAFVWLVVGLEIMLLLTWPWPTLVMTALIVGFVAGAIIAVQLRGLALEPVQQRKDTAIDAAMGTAFELQRVSGEHPTLQEPTDGEAIEPPPWQHAGERAITERCESCMAPGNIRLEDGSVWCWDCDGAARRLGYDDARIAAQMGVQVADR